MELGLCHKLYLSNFYIYQYPMMYGPHTFQTNNSVGSNNVSLKYQRATPSGWRGIDIRKFEFAAKTQLL